MFELLQNNLFICEYKNCIVWSIISQVQLLIVRVTQGRDNILTLEDCRFVYIGLRLLPIKW